MQEDLIDLDALSRTSFLYRNPNVIREDIRLVGAARRAGWTVDLGRDTDNLDDNGKLKVYKVDDRAIIHCSGDPYVFRKGNQTIWETGPYWIKASVTDDVASAHVKFTSLAEALGLAPCTPPPPTECAGKRTRKP